MKILMILLFAISLNKTVGQAPPNHSTRCKEEMKKLGYMVGDWSGEAVYRGKTITQTEHIEWKLEGVVLAIDGTGIVKNATTSLDEIAFRAFGLINFDPMDQQFKFKSYVKEGHATNAYFKVSAENRFEWGFGIPNSNAKSKYNITLDPVKITWHETGEYSADGNTWMQFIELNLTKK